LINLLSGKGYHYQQLLPDDILSVALTRKNFFSIYYDISENGVSRSLEDIENTSTI